MEGRLTKATLPRNRCITTRGVLRSGTTTVAGAVDQNTRNVPPVRFSIISSAAGIRHRSPVAVVVVALSMGGCFRKHDLTSAEVGAVISRSEEFNKSRTLVRVESIDRGAPSMTTWALIGFSFSERRNGGSGSDCTG